MIQNAKYWKKAYMLEFFIDGNLEAVFTFSCPPQNESIENPQRVTETKTFGGSNIDDYGNDTVKITLSGSTFNNEAKFIYRGALDPTGDYLTGDEEILELENLLKKYGKFDKLKDSKKKVYLYDLGKMSAIERATKKASRNWWQVAIKNFKTTRSKDSPYAYNYTIEMIGAETDQLNGAQGSIFAGALGDVLQKVQGVADKVQGYMSQAQFVVACAGEVVNTVSKAKNKLEELQQPDVLTIAGFVDKTMRILTGEQNNSAYAIAKDCKQVAAQFKGLATGKKVPESQTATSHIVNYKTIEFKTDGGSKIEALKVEYGATATEPDAPTKDFCSFEGWYKDKDCTQIFDWHTNIIEDITLYAKWIQSVAKITFINTGGTYTPPVYVDIGKCAEMPVTPKRERFLFVCWCTDENCTKPFDFTKPITEDMTLYALFDFYQTYIVTYVTNGGEKVEPINIPYGKTAIYPLMRPKENCLLEGWYTDRACTDLYDFSKPVIEDITLYAKWQRTGFTVKFETFGGTEIPSQIVTPKTRAIKPETPVRKGFSFAGWYVDDIFQKGFSFNKRINEDVTLYAKWDSDAQCTVFFKAKDAENYIAPQKVAYGERAYFPERPQREGYSFVCWCTDDSLMHEYDFSEPVRSSMILYGKWYGNTYTVVFNADNDAERIENVTACNKAHFFTPVKQCYHFAGWFTDDEFLFPFDFDTPVEHDYALFAKWELTDTIVKFDTDGGSVCANQIVTLGSKAKEPTEPSKLGYKFAGWFTDQTCLTPYNFDSVILDETTIYAKWELTTFSVTFETFGGTDIPTQILVLGRKIIPPADPQKIGYEFGGWYTDKLRLVPYNFSTKVETDFTLYALWHGEKYTIEYETNGASKLRSEIVNAGSILEQKIVIRSDGLELEGWFIDEEFTTPFDFTQGVDRDYILHAKWKENPYTAKRIEFNANGGVGVPLVQIVPYMGKAQEPKTGLPTRDRYEFLCWTSNPSEGEAFNFESVIYKDMTLYALWRKLFATVRFYTDYQNPILEFDIDLGGVISPPDAPQKDGYSFDCWIIKGTEDLYDFSAPVTGDLNLKALYIVDTGDNNDETNGQ